MPRYRVTRTERGTHDIDCANPDQALEIAHSGEVPEWDWHLDGDDATQFGVTEIGPGASDAEARREALEALASMTALSGGVR